MNAFKIGAPSVKVYAKEGVNINPQGATIVDEFVSKGGQGSRHLVIEFNDKQSLIVKPEVIAFAHTQTPMLGVMKEGKFELAADVSEGEFVINPDAQVGVNNGMPYVK